MPRVSRKPDARAMYQAADRGDTAALRRLLDAGVDVNVPCKDTTSMDRDTFEQSRTPLLVAAAGGHEAAAMLLVARGADVNARGSFGGETALVEAARTGQVKLVIALLERG